MNQRSAVIALTCLLLAAPLAAAEAPATYGLFNGTTPEAGMISAGQPTAEQVGELADAGFKTIIDLRTPQEDRGFDEPAAVAAAGMSYVALPVGGGELDDETFESFFKQMEQAERPMVVHCKSANRVGALYYAYLVAESGLPRPMALEKGRRAGLRSEQLVAAVDAYLDRHRVN